jgi:hypothetical protein
MSRLGISSRWTSLIMKCISSISYSILINGSLNSHINPSCGICQGDPLSPYLFIMCTEASSAMLQMAERNQKIIGVPIARGRVKTNHLFLQMIIFFFTRQPLKNGHSYIWC